MKTEVRGEISPGEPERFLPFCFRANQGRRSGWKKTALIPSALSHKKQEKADGRIEERTCLNPRASDGFSFVDSFQKREKIAAFPCGCAGTDFDGFRKASAFASGPPCASTDGNKGKNLRQTMQRVFSKWRGHTNPPFMIVSRERIIGFLTSLF
jgi:hypothetical protein